MGFKNMLPNGKMSGLERVLETLAESYTQHLSKRCHMPRQITSLAIYLQAVVW